MTLAHTAPPLTEPNLTDLAAADLGELGAAVLDVLACLAEPRGKTDTAASAAYRARTAATQLVTALEDLEAADANLRQVQRRVAEHLPGPLLPHFRPGLNSVTPALAKRWLADTVTAIEDLIGLAQHLSNRVQSADPDLAKRVRTALLVVQVGTDHAKRGH
ncbi:hypothetical protein AB0H58_32430 [Nocardia neocaledoniensis]|uniref:hypothetical protein n=1 Tax=Nocardia neocaledoniensis TaxID=236511 RepID=UPI0033C64264